MNKICKFCGSDYVKTKKVRGEKISICENCELGFNDISSILNYEEETHFNVNERQLNQWNIFANRDYGLIKSIIQDNNVTNVLEIGAGYGLLSQKIQNSHQVENIYSFELNKTMQNFMKENGLNIIDSIDHLKDQKIDLIIMNHVLEHIECANKYVVDILDKFPHAKLILFQTNHMGFIPKYFPYLWYGWQLDQHYFHFTPKVFESFAKINRFNFKVLSYYRLDQVVSLSIKGLIKTLLYFINKFFIHGDECDAFVCILSKQEL